MMGLALQGDHTVSDHGKEESEKERIGLHCFPHSLHTFLPFDSLLLFFP
jgi:hypothetical protein